MRLTEYMYSINNGIQSRELYSHIDIASSTVRNEITETRSSIKKINTVNNLFNQLKKRKKS